MTEILVLLQSIAPLLEKTTLHQLSQVIFGMLVTSGPITVLGLSRWTEKGGSYRTLQRLYHTVLPRQALHWLFFRARFLQAADEHIIAGDEVVVSKAGTKTYGLDRFSQVCKNRSFRACRFLLWSWSMFGKSALIPSRRPKRSKPPPKRRPVKPKPPRKRSNQPAPPKSGAALTARPLIADSVSGGLPHVYPWFSHNLQLNSRFCSIFETVAPHKCLTGALSAPE